MKHRGVARSNAISAFDESYHLGQGRWARLKEGRAVATRYEKTASSFMGVLCLAAAFDWLKC